MWTPLPLQPWWIRTFWLASLFLISAFAVVAFIRYNNNASPNPFNLPGLGIVLIAVACVGLAGLLAAVGGQWRTRYQQALQATSTPAETLQAVAAVWRGPVPDNPRVRDAAGKFAWLKLSAYRKNRKLMWIVYPFAVLTQLWGAVDAWAEHQHHRAIGSAILAGLFLMLFAWQELALRRLATRVALLAPALLNSDGATAK